MKRKIVYTADRGRTLSGQNISEFALDAKKIELLAFYIHPVVTIESTRTNGTTGRIKSISLENS